MVAPLLVAAGMYGFKAIMAMPLILRTVKEATEAVEEIGGAGTGPQKKQAVMEAVDAAYDAASAIEDSVALLPKGVFMMLAGTLVETVVGLQNTTKGGRDANQLAAL
jgi:hypothetical protein